MRATIAQANTDHRADPVDGQDAESTVGRQYLCDGPLYALLRLTPRLEPPKSDAKVCCPLVPF